MHLAVQFTSSSFGRIFDGKPMRLRFPSDLAGMTLTLRYDHSSNGRKIGISDQYLR